jgi:hypothetical protein
VGVWRESEPWKDVREGSEQKEVEREGWPAEGDWMGSGIRW